MLIETTRYIGRPELAHLLSMRDLEGVIRLPDFPLAVRLNSRVFRWPYEEVLEWLAAKRETRPDQTVGRAAAGIRRPRRRPR
jgi:predicted DNA-binding transcriptional regulator AlpA